MSRTLNTVPELLKYDSAVFQSLFNLYFGQVTEMERNNGYMLDGKSSFSVANEGWVWQLGTASACVQLYYMSTHNNE